MQLDAADHQNVTQNARISIAAVAVCVLVSLSLTTRAFSADAVPLRHAENGLAQRVQTRLKAEGKLLVGAGDERRELPLHVAGELTFVEKSVESKKDGSPLAIRHYEAGRANIAVDGRPERTRLSETRRLIAVEKSDGAATFYSPLGPLTRDDSELVNTQCDPLLLRDLLPRERVTRGDHWQASDTVIAGLFGLDMVDEQDVECQVTSLNPKQAVIRFAGAASGAALGAKSKLKIDGEFTFDRQRNQIARVSATINEQRDVGDFAPGFELEASIESSITPIDMPAELTAEKLAEMPLERTLGNSGIDFASPSIGFAFIHDRRWRVTLHRRDLLVLRMVDEGRFIAQCNISPVGPAVDDAETEMTKFQGQVAQSLSKHAGQIDEVSQATTEADIDIVRVAASGKNNDLPMRWVYYLLTDESENRLAVVFTLTEKQTEQFATADHDLIGSIRFLDAEKAASATQSATR